MQGGQQPAPPQQDVQQAVQQAQTAAGPQAYIPGSRQFPFHVPGTFIMPDGSNSPMNSLGDGISQLDVRTKNMRALEEASLPLLFQTLLNPASIGQMFGGMAGPVPGMAAAPEINASVMDASGQQNAAANFLSQLFGGAGGGMSGGGGSGGGVIPNPPPLNLPPVNNGNGGGTGGSSGGSGSQPQQPGSQPYPVSNTPTTYPGAMTPDLPNQYGGIGNIIPGNIGTQGELLAPPTGGAPQFNLPGIGPVTQLPDGSFFASDLGTTVDPGVLRQHGIDFKAAGGVLDPAMMTIVGERGPEMITPGAAGQQQVVPLSGMQAAGGVGVPGMGMPAGRDPTGGMNFSTMQRLPNATASGNALQLLGAPAAGLGGAAAAGPGGTMLPGMGRPGVDPTGGMDFSNASRLGGPAQAPAGRDPLGGLDMSGMQRVLSGGQQQVPGNHIAGRDPTAGLDFSNVPMLGGGSNTFSSTPLQGMGTGPAARLAEQNPEMQTFDLAKGILGGQQNPGQGVVNAMQPVFQQNLQSSLGQLRNFAPSVFNSQTGLEGANIGQRALNDFNVVAAQALQQGVSQQQQGLGILGQLAGQAGNGAFNRMLGAGQLDLQRQLTGAQSGLLGAQTQDVGAARQQQGQQISNQYNLGLGGLANEQLLGLRGQDIQRQLGLTQLGQQQQQFQSNYGLAAQQQQYNQTANPTLQLLLAALGMAQPTAYQTVVGQN